MEAIRQSQTFALPSHCDRPWHDGTVFVWLRNAGAAIVRAGVQVACGPPFWKAMGKLRMGSGAEFSRQPRCTGRAFEPCAAVCCIQRPGALQQHCATVCTCLVEASLFSEDGGKTGGSTGPASHPPPNRGGACSGEGPPPIWRPESGRAPIAGRAPHGAQALAVTQVRWRALVGVKSTEDGCRSVSSEGRYDTIHSYPIHIISITTYKLFITTYLPLVLPPTRLYYLLATPLSKDGTSLDFLASANDHRGKGVGSTLAESLEGFQYTDARLLQSKP